MPPEDEALLNARLKEIDEKIADLQRQRRQVVEAKAGLKSAQSEPPAERQPQELDEKLIERSLYMLEWNAFKKKDGEWAFLRTRDGQLVEDLKPIVDFIDQLRKGRRLQVGRYDYVVSEDKFLNRYPRSGDRS